MTTRTITKEKAVGRGNALPRWVWFVGLWCGGVAAAMLLGLVFKVFMNATLFAVMK